MTGAIAGLILGLVSWLVYAAVGYGGVNQDALFEVRPYYNFCYFKMLFFIFPIILLDVYPAGSSKQPPQVCAINRNVCYLQSSHMLLLLTVRAGCRCLSNPHMQSVKAAKKDLWMAQECTIAQLSTTTRA